jgi:hypothetical protein
MVLRVHPLIFPLATMFFGFLLALAMYFRTSALLMLFNHPPQFQHTDHLNSLPHPSTIGSVFILHEEPSGMYSQQ